MASNKSFLTKYLSRISSFNVCIILESFITKILIVLSLKFNNFRIYFTYWLLIKKFEIFIELFYKLKLTNSSKEVIKL